MVCQNSCPIVCLRTQDSDVKRIKEVKRTKEVRIRTIYKLSFYAKVKEHPSA
jgi:hypothetical protein